MTPDSPIGDDDAASLRQACMTLADRLRSGVDCRAEEFFPAGPIPETLVDSVLELIYTEFVVREDLGQHPSRDDWYARFPQWRERLTRLFEIGPLFDAAEDILDEDGTVLPENVLWGPGNGEAGRQAPTRDLSESGDTADQAARPVWIDENRLLNRVDHGATAIVYRALQVSLDRIVALKMMRDREVLHPAHQQRFEDDARKMASLQHPNIITVYSVGGDSGIPYFTMEFAEGGTLRDKIAHRPMPDRDAASCVETLARAVQYAHDRNLIHRDLKPSNIVLMADGTPKITDFGLAKEVAEDPTTYATVAGGGSICGTVAYMAPEQAAGQPATRRTDIYGLGAILYEMLTGQPPFPTDSNIQSLERIRKEEPKEPHQINPKVDRSLEAICLKCLEKRPKHRYATAAALAADLGRWEKGKPVAGRSWTQRMARVLRKHSRLCVRSLAIALASVSFLVVASFRSPERQAEGPDQSRLVAPLVLIGETGGPKWNNIQTVFGETAICHETSKHTYELVAPGLGLAELMTDSRCDRYRLEAEVRHDETQSPNGGRVGIYFSRTKQESPGKPVHCMAALAYSDFRPENAALIRPAGETTIRPSNMVSLSLQRRPPSQDGEGGARATILQHFFDPPDPVPSPRPWRRLAIEVTPERMRAYWDDQLVGEKTIDYIVHRARNYPDFRHDPLDPIPAFGPHGGLGLYVYRGTASFRNVIIRPLDDVR